MSAGGTCRAACDIGVVWTWAGGLGCFAQRPSADAGRSRTEQPSGLTRHSAPRRLEPRGMPPRRTVHPVSFELGAAPAREHSVRVKSDAGWPEAGR